jgi:hypothetical protein
MNVVNATVGEGAPWPRRELIYAAVLRTPIRSDPDLLGQIRIPDVCDRIRFRILALIKDHISTFLVCVKAMNTVV